MPHVELVSATNVNASKRTASRTAGLLLSLCSLATLSIACGGPVGAKVPEGARVEILQTDMLVMRGTSPDSLTSVACTAAAPSKPQHVLALNDDTNGNIRLRSPAGEAPFKMAMLHVTHLESNRTWCTTTHDGGGSALIPGEFPSGTYAIAVASAPGDAHRYEVVFQKL